MKKNVLVTGCSGYVGSMIVDQLLHNEEVGMIVGIDKEDLDDLYKQDDNIKLLEDKFIFIKKNLSDKSWMGIASKFNFDIVIHTAWQIRALYGKKNLQWEWNVGGSQNVFDFAFDKNNSIKKLIHYSTVASYGAYPSNTVEHMFSEGEAFRPSDYLYAEEKRIVEENLRDKYQTALKTGYAGQVVVIRPASITGPRGRMGKIRFGLQSALAGTYKGTTSFIYSFLSYLTSFTPVTSKWLRQFVHEDDIVDLTIKSVFYNFPNNYNAFNVCPPGAVMLGADMAQSVGKRAVNIHPQLIRLVFFFAWHLTRGKVPTSKSVWKGYSYPIAVDGSLISKVLDYSYKYNSKDAFTLSEGRYYDLYV
jgi:nucleoside-diphosphate-sugar epimerase